MDIGINGNWQRQSRIRQRSEKQAERFRRRFQKERRLHRAIRENAMDILHSSNFRKTKQHVQHGTMTVNSPRVSRSRKTGRRRIIRQFR